jgi:hypothetical protein
MRLEARSKTVLAITKSKAKMYEFGIPEADHIGLPHDPKNLLITTIGILGELAAQESRGEGQDGEDIQSLKSELTSVGQYFDSLVETRLADDLSVYLKLIGAAAYYLADMPGSATVLSKSLPYNPQPLTPTFLEGLLIWILKDDYDEALYRQEDSYLTQSIDEISEAYRGYFDLSVSELRLIELATQLRQRVYEYGNDRELLFVDVIVALVLRKISNSSITCLPLYTAIPLEQWLVAINRPTFIREFWPAQRLLGEKGVLGGASAVVQMPTSAGKTKSTELIIRSAFLSGRADVAVVVAPYRALCREITATFQEAFKDDEVNINELQDVMDVSDFDQEIIRFLTSIDADQNESNSIVITTPEKLVYLLRHEPQLAESIGLLILDEGHQFDTGRRGVTYELLMASLKSSVDQNAQKVLISAVMANANSIGEWLNGETGIEIQGSHCLPSVRSVAFSSWTTALGQLHYVDQENATDRDFFVPRVIEQINLGTRGQERNDRLFPARNDNSSMAAYLGVKLSHQGPVAIFCGVKSSVATISKLLVDYYDRGLQLPPPSEVSDHDELEKIAFLAELHFGPDYIFVNAIRLGILPHSSNVPNGIRVSVERAMEDNKAALVVCTSTLAQGVNLPIKYLIISSTFQAGQEISTRDFHNLIGRAGRSGYHTEGSIIFANADIYDQRENFRKKWKWERALHLLDFTNAEDCASSLKDVITPFKYEAIETDAVFFSANPELYRQACVQISVEQSLDMEPLLEEMAYKESLVQAIESYFLSYLKDNPDAGEEFFIELLQGTLAYYLSDEEERQSLNQVFSNIASRVLSIPREKYAFYGKALLGIDQLLVIDQWVDAQYFQLELVEDAVGILELCWPLIQLLNKNKTFLKIQPVDVLLEFAKKWISGFSYVELLNYLLGSEAIYQANTQRRAIKMEHVVDLADSALSFDSMLYVGAIADISEGKGLPEELVECLRELQTRLKLGLSSRLEIWLYSKGYVDREVCKRLALSLIGEGVPAEGFDYNTLDSHSQVVTSALSAFPSYFAEK